MSAFSVSLTVSYDCRLCKSVFDRLFLHFTGILPATHFTTFDATLVRSAVQERVDHNTVNVVSEN